MWVGRGSFFRRHFKADESVSLAAHLIQVLVNKAYRLLGLIVGEQLFQLQTVEGLAK